MILTDFALQTDRGDKIRTYIEPLVGMMVRDPLTSEDWVVNTVNNSTRQMTLSSVKKSDVGTVVDYSKQIFLLSPGRNGEFEWAGVKA